MRYFALWDTAKAEPVQHVGCYSDIQLPAPGEGQEWHELSGDIEQRTLTLVDGEVTEIDRVLPLPMLRALKWAEAKAYRDRRMSGSCMTPLGRVDIDADSQRKISGAALAAVIAKGAVQPFSLDWTMADNSVVTHDADAMIAMGMAVTEFLAACQQAGTAIRDRIDGADDATSLAAVDITAGYPA